MLSWQTAVERTVTGLGYDLVDTERTAGGLLRVYLDRVVGDPAGEFVTVDDCEKVTRQLQHVLEVEGCSYERLEVSSPGLDRPLKRAADYARFEGAEIDLTLKLPFKGRKKYRGVLHAHGQGWRVVFSRSGNDGGNDGDNDSATDQALDFSLDEVREARLVPVIDFKGRRFSASEGAGSGAGGTQSQGSGDEVDGGRIQ
jgi:ribosome maturation factor RimP